MIIVAATGFLSMYAQENKIEPKHPVRALIKDLTRIVILYREKCRPLVKESFDLFEKIVGEDTKEVDCICFANALLTFQQRDCNKYFHPKYKEHDKFWLEYKKHKRSKCENVEDRKAMNLTYSNSRLLAAEFIKIIKG